MPKNNLWQFRPNFYLLAEYLEGGSHKFYILNFWRKRKFQHFSESWNHEIYTADLQERIFLVSLNWKSFSFPLCGDDRVPTNLKETDGNIIFHLASFYDLPFMREMKTSQTLWNRRVYKWSFRPKHNKCVYLLIEIHTYILIQGIIKSTIYKNDYRSKIYIPILTALLLSAGYWIKQTQCD